MTTSTTEVVAINGSPSILRELPQSRNDVLDLRDERLLERR
jgi:hypothetical protein